MSRFPESWDTVAIGDVFDVQLGKMLSKKAKTGNSSFRYLGNKNVQWNRVDIDELQEMDFSPAEREKFALRPGDLLVCEGGEVGRTAVWRGEIEDCYYQKALHRLRPKKGRVLPEFMLRFMRLAAERDMFAGLTSQTSIAHLTKEKLETLEMPLPPLPEQKRIAAILDKADAIRRKRQEAIRLTEELLRSAFLEMFGDPVTNPKGWEVKKLGDHLSFVTSGSRGWAKYYAREGTRFIRSLDVRMNFIAQTDPAFVTAPASAEADRTRVKDGDVLLTITGSRIGRVAPVEPLNGDAHISQHVAILRPKEELFARYLSMYLSLASGGQRQIAKTQYGQTKPGLNLEQIREFVIPLPPADQQRRFALFWGRQLAMRQRLQRTADATTQFSASLTQRAFSGRL